MLTTWAVGCRARATEGVPHLLKTNFLNSTINPNLTATFSQQNTHKHRRDAPCASAFQILIYRDVSLCKHGQSRTPVPTTIVAIFC